MLVTLMSEDNINMSAVAAVASSDHQVSSKTWGNYVIKGLVQPRWRVQTWSKHKLKSAFELKYKTKFSLFPIKISLEIKGVLVLFQNAN